MKKIISAGFNIFIYANLAYALFSGVYLSLPVEYQFLANYSWSVGLIGAGTTTLLGTGGLYLKSLMVKHGIEIDDKTNDVIRKFLMLTAKYDEVNAKYTELVNSVNRNNTLLEIDLNSKLSNPLIDEKVRLLIEGILNGDTLNEGASNDEG